MNEEDEAYEEYTGKSKKPSIFQTAPRWQLTIIVILFLITLWVGLIKEPPLLEKNTTLFFLFVLAVAFIIMIFQHKPQGIITMSQARNILRNELLLMQKDIDTEIPAGDIFISERAKLRRMEGQRHMWNLGFHIIGPHGPKTYHATIDPWDGLLESIIEMPKGWTGKEQHDISFILPKELKWAQRYGDTFETIRRAKQDYEETQPKKGLFKRK